MKEGPGGSMYDFTPLDRPEILQFLFYPRSDFFEEPMVENATVHHIAVDEGISISCRLYTAGEKAPVILYFHGNGEIASDYDQIAPLFNQLGASLFVADYRGYGSSGGMPTFSAMMQDAFPIFSGLKDIMRQKCLTGKVFVMGRSLGSAPAIELARYHQDELGGLIVESGFAGVGRLAELAEGAAGATGTDRARLSFNLEWIRSVTIPTLIIHGEYDNLVSLQNGLDLYQNSGADDKRLLVVPGAGHNDIFLIGMKDYLKAIEEFVAA